MSAIALPLLLLSLVGSGYTLHAARAVRRFGRAGVLPRVPSEPVSLLKPLHGAEPRLAENLAGFLDQDWDAPIELVAGVQRDDDPAIGVVEGLHTPAQAGERNVRLVVDATSHGTNGKVSNLINMMPAVSHDLIVLSDSDMAVPRDYLATLIAALAEPGVGAVTCLYRGRGDAGPWSLMAAAGISYQFLPSVLLARMLGIAEPAMGSTIALRRDTLQRIGGFQRFADILADDNAIGEAVCVLGLRVAMPPMVLIHGCAETSVRAVVRHEVRWAATIRAIDRWSHLGLIATHPIPFALLALPFAPVCGAAALGLAVLARLLLIARVDRLVGAATAPRALLIPRDCLSFVVFLLSFLARSVDWRGSRLRMGREGRIAPAPESRRP